MCEYVHDTDEIIPPHHQDCESKRNRHIFERMCLFAV